MPILVSCTGKGCHLQSQRRESKNFHRFRNELAGALSGLTRVRRFQQDDAHIFCRTDQIGQEMVGALQFLRRVYEEVFGFQFQLYLSTRPEDYMGELADW